MKKYTKILLIAVLLVSTTISSWGQIPFSKGRIAISSDGNFYDDDDFGATAASLALLAKAKLQDKLVLYVYADHIWGNEKNDLAKIRESALGGRDRWNFNNTTFIEGVTNKELAFNSMRDAINASSSNDPLFIICAGPMEVIGTAMQRAQQSKRQYVTLISHASWNEKHADNPENNEPSHSGWTWDEMKNAFSNAKFDRIDSQNHQEIKNQGFNTAKAGPGGSKDWASWHWMRDSNDANIKWLYSRVEAVGRPDLSDCGMVWYLIHNDENGGPQKMKNYIGSEIAVGGGNNGGGANCGTAWKANGNYAKKDIVSFNGKKWRWKPNKNGNCRPGSCKKWKNLGNCSSKSINNTVVNTSLDIKVYPNPAKDVITVSGLKIGDPIIIYNLLGKVLVNHISKNEKESIDISTLKSGLYVISASNNVVKFNKN